MERRTGESPMDFEWQSGTTDPSSPFGALNRNQSMQTPARKRPFGVFESPDKPSVPSLTEPNSQKFLFSTPNGRGMGMFGGAAFTTPRHLDSEVFSSGAETSPAGNTDADTEDTPEATSKGGTVRGVPLFLGKSSKTDNTALVPAKPVAPGRGEIKKTRYTDAVARRIQKRRLAEKRNLYAIPSEDSEDDLAKKREPKQGMLGSVLSWIEAHPQLPHVLSFYVQLFLNLSLVLIFLYLLYSFWATIRSDVDKRSSEVAQETLAEMANCANSFVENRCERAQRVPAMDKICNEWELCMNRNPDAVGRARVSAHTFAEIFNSFIEPISWKAMIFAAMITASCFAVSNLAFNLFRAKTETHPMMANYMHPPQMTPQHSAMHNGYYGNYGDHMQTPSSMRVMASGVPPSASRRRLAY
jgi:hypothetical protein